MNEIVKKIATETFNKLPMDKSKPEQWIDNFVLEYTKAILFEATDVIRTKAKDYDADTAIVLKATAIDVLDRFGV